MIRVLSLVALLCVPFAPAMAEQGTLKLLSTGSASRGWEAVGRLELGKGSFCTGTLIAPDQVLTAAHCLFDSTTGAMIPTDQIEFRAGWRNGRAVAYRGVRRAMVPPAYQYQGADKIARVARDLALIELDQPIRLPQLRPFTLDTAPVIGETVGVVSYAHDRAEAPSLQDVCQVLERAADVVMMNCAADFGSSGAPVFAMRDGEPHIVSVISAKAARADEPVSLGSLVDHVADLRAAMKARSDAPNAQISRAKGAKFIRP
ncbi:trypsin-like peptidase domain-containing protein [Paenirhodobacter sp. CAU 1674]|uniref:trypsin-like serine peptidase n=1 Tax=Paenirhodobacter sp. CAU 1674 TaxID=3032596 RepID=UPI0023D9AD5C|nr:trypsin-like peptidase domain-containing protein [Paenirhodobacter sp. CAU 1674]MDF2141435.1 trypsin-like peptidase domain-containing protein [Paenirhodobacter sp. CAU 1674]